jgi:hypothetical protein
LIVFAVDFPQHHDLVVLLLFALPLRGLSPQVNDAIAPGKVHACGDRLE